jgi:hypothetical protein
MQWQIQWNPVKKILKIPRKSYFLSGKFLTRVILTKWENFGAFLSWLLRREIFLTGGFFKQVSLYTDRLEYHKTVFCSYPSQPPS